MNRASSASLRKSAQTPPGEDPAPGTPRSASRNSSLRGWHKRTASGSLMMCRGPTVRGRSPRNGRGRLLENVLGTSTGRLDIRTTRHAAPARSAAGLDFRGAEYSPSDEAASVIVAVENAMYSPRARPNPVLRSPYRPPVLLEDVADRAAPSHGPSRRRGGWSRRCSRRRRR